MEHVDVLKAKLEILMQQHRDIDTAIQALEAMGHRDDLQIKRLKKQKLLLKDRISWFEDQINPDIIA